jgi:hypothetical protein
MYQKWAGKQEMRRNVVLPKWQPGRNAILVDNFRAAQGAKNSLFLSACFERNP